MPTRRQFVGSVGAGLLLAPFINMGLAPQGAAPGASSPSACWCSAAWGPTRRCGPPRPPAATITTWSAMTQPLSAIAGNIILVEGMPSGNPNDGHGASDSLTGQGFGYYGQGVIKISVDQFVANKLAAGGINRPIASLLLGANCNENGGLSQFYGGTNGGNLPTIGSPLVGLQHRLRQRAADRDVGLGAARAPAEHPRLRHRRDQRPGGHAGQQREGQAGRAPRLDPRSSRTSSTPACRRGSVCTKPSTPGADSTFQYMGDMDALAANLIHQQIIVQRVRLRHHARRLPRVRQRPEADGQRALQLRLAVRRSARRLHPQRRLVELREPGEVRGLPGDPVRQHRQRAARR